MSADTAWTIAQVFFVIAILAAVWGLWLRRTGIRAGLAQLRDPAFGRKRAGRRAEAALLQMAGGDDKRVERLIAAEQKRDPDGDRAAWAIAAHKRWLADLR